MVFYALATLLFQISLRLKGVAPSYLLPGHKRLSIETLLAESEVSTFPFRLTPILLSYFCIPGIRSMAASCWHEPFCPGEYE